MYTTICTIFLCFRRICVNEHGERLGDYSAELNTPEYTNMDCSTYLEHFFKFKIFSNES